MSNTAVPSAIQAFQEIATSHRQVIAATIQVLAYEDAKTCSQEQLLTLVQCALDAALQRVTIEHEFFSFILQKYESCGLYQQQISTSDTRVSLTPLGVTLTQIFQFCGKNCDFVLQRHTSTNRWCPKTLWRVESFIRRMQHYQIGVEYSLESLAKDILQHAAEFGLFRLARLSTACQLLQCTFTQRFDLHTEIRLSANMETFTILRSLST